ncbi:unnamed protein product [Rotaria sp. Silwood1]|nr:unnamed protein product [Rotaria sp. Silwood1]
MAKRKKSTADDNDLSSEDAHPQFGISIQELEKLMQTRGHEGIKELKEIHGGLSGIEQKLKTNLITGLSGKEIDLSTRIATFGRNEIPQKSPPTFLCLMCDALKSWTLITLIICAIILFALSFYHPSGETLETKIKSKETNVEWIESAAIIIVVLVVVLVTAFSDWRNERQYHSFQSMIELNQKCNTIRESTVQQIPIKDIVVGDICEIKYGDVLPADGVVVQSNGLKVDEYSLTGDSDLIKKNESRDPFLLSGTCIMEGSGKMLVLAVGEHSQMGMIFKLLGTIKEENNRDKRTNDNKKQNAIINKDNASASQEVIPDNANQTSNEDDPIRFKMEKQSVLHTQLAKLNIQFRYAGMIIVILTILVLLVSFSIEELIQRREWGYKYWTQIVRYFITCITVFILIVPESLSTVATLSLTHIAKKMAMDNNLVRHLDACETIGNTTTICSNKAGILTTNYMTVVQVYVGENHWKNVENPAKAKEIIIPANTKEIIFEGVSVNSSYFSQLLPPEEYETLAKQVGNQTECSLLGFVGALGGNYDEIRRCYPEEQFVHVYKFKSARKYMSTVIQRPDSIVRMYTKGASEIVLKKCKTILNRNGDIVPFSNIDYDHLVRTVIEPMACDGLRTICIAYRDFSSDDLPDWDDEANVVDQLTCICICGIEDPVRPEIPDAIAKCRNAGITVRMVTGDNVNTARSIALKCGIISANDDCLALEGKEFNQRIRSRPDGKIEQNLFDKIWPNLRVLASSSPQDKYVLVRGIMASKIYPIREVVAIIGSETNDVSALKAADVGFAMGIQGTDRAKEASDIILLDENFNSIVKAVMWGRQVYDSIARTSQFKLTINFATILCVFIGACIVKESPLRVTQIFWINSIMATLASLALASEVSAEDLLTCKPYERIRPLISRTTMKNIIGHIFYQLVIMAFILFAGAKIFDIDDGHPVDSIYKPSKHFTIIFNVFVLMNLFNEINCRKIHGEKNVFRGIFTNSTFYGIWIVTFVIQIVLVQYGSFLFSCVALTFKQWMWCFLFGVSVLLWHQMINLIPTTRHMPKLSTHNIDEPASPDTSSNAGM